jgi:exodeoxyribonuclease VII large subunit
MRPDRKRPLPRYPSRIAVVTSPRGKAVHDVLRTLRRRYPVAEVLLAGVPVEGADAANGLVEGLRVAAEARPEVILIVRGGGSYEDLMPFNSEALARAIALSPVPVVSGIGHEPDTTIADMVADVRASTPTAAAEAAVPDSAEMTLALEREGRLLGRALQHRVQESAHRVRLLVERPVFQQAGALLGPVAQTIDAAAQALHRSIPARLERDAQRVELARERLVRVGRRLTEPARGAVTAASAQLESLSPLAVMARGYAVMYAADGSTVVRDPQQVDVADAVVVRVALGRIDCTVTGTEGAE